MGGVDAVSNILYGKLTVFLKNIPQLEQFPAFMVFSESAVGVMSGQA